MKLFPFIIASVASFVHNKHHYSAIKLSAVRQGRDGKIYIGEPEIGEVVKEKIRDILDKVLGGPHEEPNLQPIPIPVEDYPEQASQTGCGGGSTVNC